MGQIPKLPVRRQGTKVTFLARLSYVHLDEPWSNDANSEKKYSVSAIIPKSDVDAVREIRAAIDEAITTGVSKVWKGKRPNPNASTFKYPLKDGDTERPDDEPYQGAMFMGCNSKNKVATLNPLRADIDPKEVYSGCYALVSVNFFPFDSGSKGVGAGLQSVLMVAHGEKLGGAGDGRHDFDDYDLSGIAGLTLGGEAGASDSLDDM